jgi:MFS family permease
LAVGWAVLADTIPLYPLYALLFADAGLSDARISTLLLIWTATGIVAEVPAGALADRFSRRGAIVASGVLQAAGYVLWMLVPTFGGFAAGFVLWGVGGAFASGALEALLYENLAAEGAEAHYPGLYGRVSAAGLACQVPAAAAATVLYGAGSYTLVGWVSVGCCLGASALATRLPERRRPAGTDRAEPGVVATLRAGMAEAAGHPAVRAAALAVAVLGGLDAVEEYFPLLARSWGVATAVVPLALVAIPLVGAAGAALGGAAGQLRPRTLALLLGVAVTVFATAGLLHRPAGVAGIALAYGTFQVVLVVTDAHLQRQLRGPARATVTSLAAFGTELTALGVVAVWAVGRPALLVALGLAVAAALPRLLRPSGAGAAPADDDGRFCSR